MSDDIETIRWFLGGCAHLQFGRTEALAALERVAGRLTDSVPRSEIPVLGARLRSKLQSAEAERDALREKLEKAKEALTEIQSINTLPMTSPGGTVGYDHLGPCAVRARAALAETETGGFNE